VLPYPNKVEEILERVIEWTLKILHAG
jgi:hypothetical protein